MLLVPHSWFSKVEIVRKKRNIDLLMWFIECVYSMAADRVKVRENEWLK